MDSFKERVQASIVHNALFSTSSGILLALSGGPDSVALLRVLLELGYCPAAAHCNFHLRGSESDRDEQFVRNLCGLLGVKLYVAHFNTYDYARSHGISIEMAARELRYHYFDELRCREGFDVVAVAHHRDDSIETLLLNLIRGTGLKGLTGIQPKNGCVVRPMLEVGRADVLAYLRSLQQDYVTDHTNNETVCMRNKIRLQLLPLMKTINPSVCLTLQRMSERMLDVETWCSCTLQEARQRIGAPLPEEGLSACFDIAAIMREPAPRYVLFSLLHPYGFVPVQIDEIYMNMNMSRVTGSVFYARKWELLVNRGLILLKERDGIAEPKTYEVSAGIPIFLNGAKMEISELPLSGLQNIPRERTIAVLDADKLGSGLFVRRICNGDRFKPFGMKGSKLVSDYLTDCKRSLFQKRSQYVVCTKAGEIAWLVGERIAAPFAVDFQKTKRVLLFRWKAAL